MISSKNRQAIALFVFGFTLLLLGAWLVGWIPTYAEYCEQNAQTHQKDCATYHIALIAVWQIEKVLDASAPALTAIATGFIAWFTLTLKRATDRLWDAGERQLDHLTESSERQLRAYVFPVEAILTKISVGHSVECKIVTKNSGQTPAYRLTHVAVIGLANFPPEGPFPECVVPQRISKISLGPGAPIHKLGRRDAPLSEADLSRLKAGTAAIYLLGRIDFIDAFGRDRWVKYRYMTGGDAGFDSEGRLAVCQDGNETSDEEDIESEAGHDQPPVRSYRLKKRVALAP